MQKCAHMNVVKVISCFIEGENVYVVMRKANSGNLKREISKRVYAKQPFTEVEIINFFTQICLGLRAVHKKNIIHRDLKTSNIFLHSENDNKVCILGDFGVGKELSTMTNMAIT